MEREEYDRYNRIAADKRNEKKAPKPKVDVWQLMFNGQQLIHGSYSLCVKERMKKEIMPGDKRYSIIPLSYKPN